jgi:hypothetical protein
MPSGQARIVIYIDVVRGEPPYLVRGHANGPFLSDSLRGGHPEHDRWGSPGVVVAH